MPSEGNRRRVAGGRDNSIEGNAGRASSADDAYHAITDSYAPAFAAQDPSAAHCDDQFAELGGPGLNGYPLQCGRLESAQFNNLDTWFPIAAVNRLDLAAVDGSDCGQQRLVFANNAFLGNGRMLLIVEAEVPNPNPGCGVDACLPVAQFWADVEAEADPFVRAGMLSNAFLGAGIGSGFGPFVNAEQLGPSATCSRARAASRASASVSRTRSATSSCRTARRSSVTSSRRHPVAACCRPSSARR